MEWAANLVTCSAHTAQSGSIPDYDLHGSWRSIHIISDDIMKALPRLIAEEILGLLRDATRTEHQIALAEMYRQSYEAVTRICFYSQIIIRILCVFSDNYQYIVGILR